MKVSDILEAKGSMEVFSTTPDATLADLVKLACEKKIGALLVLDEKGKLAGIITERDILYQCNAKVDFDKTTVGAVMSTAIVAAGPDDDINLAMDMMIKRKIRHLPVMDENAIHGIITIRDLIFAMRKADETDVQYLLDYIRGNIKVP